MLKIVIVCCALVAFVSNAQAESDDNNQPDELSEVDKRHNELCGGVLSQVTLTSEIPLDLDSTREIYEVALDHLATASSYVTQMRPFLSEERIVKFDSNGSELVRAISEGRTELLAKYSSATESNASEGERRKILARHLYEACKLRVPTVMAEKMMLDLLQKIQSNPNVKLMRHNHGQ